MWQRLKEWILIQTIPVRAWWIHLWDFKHHKRMRQQRKILKAHPLFFRQYFEEDIYTSCMSWGFECGQGWFDIINRCADKMEKWNHLHSDMLPVEACQLKEKFGELRVYLDNATEETYNILHEFEKEADETCEWCGSKKDVSKTKRGWITTLCAECHKES